MYLYLPMTFLKPDLFNSADNSWSAWRQWRYPGFSSCSPATERSGWRTSGISCFLSSICPRVVTMNAHIWHLRIRKDICAQYNVIEKSITMNLHTVKQGSFLHTQLFQSTIKTSSWYGGKTETEGGDCESWREESLRIKSREIII